jgi:hypothetical protein
MWEGERERRRRSVYVAVLFQNCRRLGIIGVLKTQKFERGRVCNIISIWETYQLVDSCFHGGVFNSKARREIASIPLRDHLLLCFGYSA